MPLKVVSLAFSNSEKKAMGRPMTEGRPVEEISDFPGGLMLYLDTSELRKLGFGRGQLNPGDRVSLVGTGMVTSSSADMANGLESYRATLQVQTLGIEPLAEESNLGDTIYGMQS